MHQSGHTIWPKYEACFWHSLWERRLHCFINRNNPHLKNCSKLQMITVKIFLKNCLGDFAKLSFFKSGKKDCILIWVVCFSQKRLELEKTLPFLVCFCLDLCKRLRTPFSQLDIKQKKTFYQNKLMVNM